MKIRSEGTYWNIPDRQDVTPVVLKFRICESVGNKSCETSCERLHTELIGCYLSWPKAQRIISIFLGVQNLEPKMELRLSAFLLIIPIRIIPSDLLRFLGFIRRKAWISLELISPSGNVLIFWSAFTTNWSTVPNCSGNNKDSRPEAPPTPNPFIPPARSSPRLISLRSNLNNSSIISLSFLWSSAYSSVKSRVILLRRRVGCPQF